MVEIWFYLPCYIFKGHWILNIQTMTLAFHLGTIYKDASIRSQARKSHYNVMVEYANFTNCAVFLQLGYWFFLNAQDDTVAATDTNLYKYMN